MLRIKAIYFLCSIVFFSALTSAQNIDAVILQKEQEFLTKMKEKKLTPEKFFEAYIMAGEEFVRSGELKWGAYFFEKASKIENIKNKIPAYNRQMGALLAIPDYKEAIKVFKSMEDEFSKGKRSDEEKGMLYMYKVLISDKLHDEVLSPDEVKALKFSGRFMGVIKHHDVRIYFNRSNYAEIVKIFSNGDIQNANIDEKILLDLASTLENKQSNNHELLCKPQFDQFPQSHKSSYTMAICNMLIKVRAKKKPSQEDFEKAEGLISKKFPHSTYLIPILKKML